MLRPLPALAEVMPWPVTPLAVATAAVAAATVARLALSALRHAVLVVVVVVVVVHLSLSGAASVAIRCPAAPAAGLVQLQCSLLASKTDRLGEVTVVVVLHMTPTDGGNLAPSAEIRCADVAVVAVARQTQVLQVLHPNASCVLHANVILRDATLTAGGEADIAAPAIRCAAMTAAVGLMLLLRLHPPAQSQDPLYAMALLLVLVPATQVDVQSVTARAVTRCVVQLCKVAE